jgi:flagellar basal-body rod modification protein FlgD
MAISATATNPIDAIANVSGANKGSSTPGGAAAKAELSPTDRFLKLLVTQMQNQDPLNPMDNAQVTSQMAQISTVSGIADLNTTMQGINGQFLQLQAVQGASLIGHDVTLVGNKLDVTAGSRVGVGGFELTSPADNVKIDVMDAAGTVLQSMNLGGQPAGMNGFSWSGAADGTPYTFKVTATAAGSALSPTPLMRDHVNAVAIVNNKLTLETVKSGPVDYATVKAVS